MSQDSPELQLRAEPAKLKIAMVAARFNGAMVDSLIRSAKKRFSELGVLDGNLRLERVPGSVELCYACQSVARKKGVDAILALGVLIAGDTQHHDIVGRSVTDGLRDVSREEFIPIVNGVVITDTVSQAEERTIGEYDRGSEFADVAVEMAGWHYKEK